MKKKIILLQLIHVVIGLIILFFIYVIFIKKIFYDPVIDNQYILDENKLSNLPKDVMPVIIARNSNSSQKSYEYNLIKLLLEKSGVKFKMGFSVSKDQDISEIVSEVARDSGKDKSYGPNIAILSVYHNLSQYQELQAIKIPVYLGVNGIDISYINSDNVNIFKNTRKSSDLSGVLMQAKGWATVKIFEDLGIPVYESSASDLYYMLKYNRVDYFPVGYAFVGGDAFGIDSDYLQDVVLEPNLLFIYSDIFFPVVSKNNTKLYNAITSGFRKALQDGSFMKLFKSYFLDDDYLCKINFPSRRIIFFPRSQKPSEDIKFISKKLSPINFNKIASGEIKTGNELLLSLGYKVNCH